MRKVKSCLVIIVCSLTLTMVGCWEERAEHNSAPNVNDKLLAKTIHINKVRHLISFSQRFLYNFDSIKELQEKVARLEAQMESLTSYIRHEMDQTRLNQVERSAASPRSCHEIRSTNPSLASGMYWIDPDGQGIGDGPIYVYCDVKAGQFLMNKKSKIEIRRWYINRNDNDPAQQRGENRCRSLSRSRLLLKIDCLQRNYEANQSSHRLIGRVSSVDSREFTVRTLVDFISRLNHLIKIKPNSLTQSSTTAITPRS